MSEESPPSSNEQALKETLDELTLDIGRILHANTSTLLMVNQTLTATIETLTQGAAAVEDLKEEDIEPRVRKLATHLARAVERLAQAGSESRREEALSAEAWSQLADQVELLDNFETIVPVEEMRSPVVRKSAHRIAALGRGIAAGNLPKEHVREVIRYAEQLERETCLIDTLTTRAAVIQMDISLRALRDFITTDLRDREVSMRLDLRDLTGEVVAQLAEFARASHVDVKLHSEEPELITSGEHRELSRALSNILHNAIKYSWRRDRGSTPWVAIRLGKDGRRVYVEFETWGVPITQEEIDEGLVFQIGYRGKFSTDRGRLGTGIGLTDALRVAEKHDGALTLESRPTHPTNLKPEHPDFYKQPFLTTTRLSLPEVV